jgi:hypothetical protein
LETATGDIEASGYPQAQEFVKENVLAIPTATEAVKFFENLIKRYPTDE